jgi:hypothetical protein
VLHSHSGCNSYFRLIHDLFILRWLVSILLKSYQHSGKYDVKGYQCHQNCREAIQIIDLFFLVGEGMFQSRSSWATPSVLFFFGFSYFSDRVWHFCPRPTSDHGPPTSASHLAGVIGMHHDDCLVLQNRVSINFCLDWLWTKIFPISTSQVVVIMGMRHSSGPSILILIWPQ